MLRSVSISVVAWHNLHYQKMYFFMRLRYNLEFSEICWFKLTVKKALKTAKAIRGFFRFKGLILEAILADWISKS